MSDAYRPPVFDAPIDLDLSKNEGRPLIADIGLGPDELASITSRYPDTSDLAERIAERHEVSVSRVLVTAGGDDGLFRCFLATAGRSVVATTPSFEMIRRYAAQLQTPLIEIPWWDGDFPIGDFLEESTGDPGLAVVVSPNNPTGNVVSAADIRKLADVFPLLVLDAAYADFADDDPTPAAMDLGNVVVIRTLSKAFGLAGLRVGYALGPPEVIDELKTFGSPYAMASLSAVLASRALREGTGQAEEFAREVTDERGRLIDLLARLDSAPLPSQANFVLATDVDPCWLVPAAASLGVGLRKFGDRPELSRCVRISLPGDADGFARLETVLRTVLTPEALLFDMDGVIADVRNSFRTAIVATAARFGVSVDSSQIAAAKAGGNASDDWELTRGLCLAAGVDVSFDTVREEFERIYQGDEGQEGLKMNEGLLVDEAYLEKWSRLLPLGIVTARPRKDAAEFLDRFGIGRHFDVVVTRDDAPSKPDPAPVRLALERLGVDRAWMVGDTVDDLVAARSADVVPIGVTAHGEDPSSLSGAARVLGSPNELEEVLRATKL